MKTVKLFFSIFAIMMLQSVCCGIAAQESRVWNEIVMGYNNVHDAIRITSVKLQDDHTEVALHVTIPTKNWIKVASNIHLQAGDKRYKAQAIVQDTTRSVPVFDQKFLMPESGEVDFVITFDPLPKSTERFDIIVPKGWHMLNIRSAELLPLDITDTYWTNAKTGDWLIGFTRQHVIYDNGVWDIEKQTVHKDSYSLIVSNRAETMEISVAPMKKGIRHITIGKTASVKCRPITTNTLPDYPTKDLRQGFKDNGYREGDSVTVVGWLKDMRRNEWKKGKAFEVTISNIIADDQQSFSAPIDSLGRFILKVPLLNSSQVFLDWKRSRVSTVFEPGETYFFLSDYTTGQKLFMGTDVRLQNELLAYPHEWANTRMRKKGGGEKEAMDFLNITDQKREQLQKQLQERIRLHPKLSQRYIDFLTNNYLIGQGKSLMQARFSMKDRKLPQAYMDYVQEEIWTASIKPYTLFRDFTIFKRDYIDQLKTNVSSETRTSITRRLDEKGEISLSDEEREMLIAYEEKYNKIREDVFSASTIEEKRAIVDAFNADPEIMEMTPKLGRLYKRVESSLRRAGVLSNMQLSLQVIDSVGCDRNLRDLHLAGELYKWIDNNRKPLDPTIVTWMESEIQLPAALAAVREQNEKYLAIQQRTLKRALKSSEDVKGMSDGEKILRKIIKPYRGKLILLDIWGVWCGPCKRALKDSQKEYEHLKDYDLIYLYLANRSDEESWKNVIKEYNVTGDNVIHYNLPEEQQTAIEQYLGVNSFPTYKLIDREGNVLDVNADPRNIQALKEVLELMK